MSDKGEVMERWMGYCEELHNVDEILEELKQIRNRSNDKQANV